MMGLEADHQFQPPTYGYTVYASAFKRSVPGRVPTRFRLELTPLKAKSPLFSISQPSGERPNMPTDRKLGSDRAAELVRSAFGSDRDGDGLSFFQSIGRQSLGDILSRDAVPHIIAANPFFPIV
jgi:hypothetical protein